MKNLINRYCNIATTAALTLWCCMAQADDTEVYVGAASGVAPLAIMVLDTSGSMYETVVVNESDEYDYTIDYAAVHKTTSGGTTINYSFRTDLNYFSEFNYFSVDLSSSYIDDLKKRPFPKSALRCESANINNSFEKSGFHNTAFKRWNPSTKVWDPSISYRQYWWSRYITPGTPEGSESGDAWIDCKTDDKSGQYINTNPDNSNRYLNSIDYSTYSNAWGNYFKYIYSGNFLNYKTYALHNKTDLTKTRMQLTQEAAKHVVNTMGGIRLGLARFDYGGEGGFIDVAVDDIENIRQEFSNTIDTYVPWGGTPISETYTEVASYLRGSWSQHSDKEKRDADTLQGKLNHGKNASVILQRSNKTINYNHSSAQNYYNNNGSNVYESNTTSDSKSNNGTTYTSPITSSCQTSSSIILFTDGSPSSDESSNADIMKLLKANNIKFSDMDLSDEDREVLTDNCDQADLNLINVGGSDKGTGTCAEELAYYLANFDQSPLPGKQIIKTNIIGGFFDETSTDYNTQRTLKYMKDIAKHGDGTYYLASNKEDIIEAFEDSLGDVFDKPTTFVAPAVSANSYNSLEHLDNLYYAMFVPSADNSWTGNLKSYRLSPDGLVVDAEGDGAINNSSGLFIETSRSYWTPEGNTDGYSVAAGGAAGNLTKETNIFTHLTDKKEALSTKITTNIPKETFGVTSEEHAAVVDWLNRKSGDDTRRRMEDPLHSQPIVVNYGYTQDEDTKRITTNGVVFVGTNSGYLHAFKADKDEFKEYFSYVPKELLSNANLYRTKDETQSKAYGIDGPMNYWHVDENQNGQVDNDEKVYLFFGLRRGGRHYYALDITNPDKPKFEWQISGGEGGAFDKMGQSWSPMTLAKVKWGSKGKTKVVLLFGGGYDPDEDDQSTRTEHSMGNSIYMIDPATGTLLWSASNAGATTNIPKMTSSITSEIKIVDFDGDQITDYFFVSDLGGRIWRFDINANNEDVTKSNFIAGSGMIFDANKNNSDYQRFYDAPSVSYFSNSKTKERFLTVSIGSGFRAHPLDIDSEDSFYIIKDKNILSQPTTYQTLEQKDLVDIKTGNQTSTTLPNGWKYSLKTGEKVLSSPLTANGNMYFTTFSPSGATTSAAACNADIGFSQAYSIDFLGDDYNSNTQSDNPIVSSRTMPNIGIPPPVIELNVSETGQIAFCESKPNHESCIEETIDPDCEATGTCPDPVDECDKKGSVILSGTHIIDGGIKRCDLLKRNYWRPL